MKGRARGEVKAQSRGKGNRPVKRSRTGLILSLVIIVGVSAFVVWALLDGRLPLVAFVIILAANIGALISYAVDKSAATKGSWRISEGSLHFMELLGGWPAAFFAQQLLRHKTRKLSFQLVFWTTVLVNAAVVVTVTFPSVAAYLQRLLP